MAPPRPRRRRARALAALALAVLVPGCELARAIFPEPMTPRWVREESSALRDFQLTPYAFAAGFDLTVYPAVAACAPLAILFVPLLHGEAAVFLMPGYLVGFVGGGALAAPAFVLDLLVLPFIRLWDLFPARSSQPSPPAIGPQEHVSLDALTGAWTDEPPVPDDARAFAAAAVVSGSLHLLGERSHVVYSPSSRAWAPAPADDPIGRAWRATARLHAGRAAVSCLGDLVCVAGEYAQVVVYDPRAGRVVLSSQAPVSSASVGFGRLTRPLGAAAGRVFLAEVAPVDSGCAVTIHALDVAAGTWRAETRLVRRTSFPSETRVSSVQEAAGRTFVVVSPGGWGTDAYGGELLVRDAAGTWSTRPLPEGPHTARIAAAGGEVLLLGTEALHRFDPGRNIWTRLPGRPAVVPFAVFTLGDGRVHGLGPDRARPGW